MHTNFLTTTIISLFYYCEKVFILMNMWMIWKNLMKHYYLKKKIFTVQSDTLLLTDVFENFRNLCLKIYELDPAKSFSAPGLAWQALLKKD